MSQTESKYADVVLRESAVESMNAIVNKVTEEKFTELAKAEFELMRKVNLDPNYSESEMWKDIADLRLDFLKKNSLGLLRSISTLLWASGGGVITGDGPTGLVGSGRMMVGVVDHGNEWRAHS